MKFLEFLFALLQRFINFDPARIATIKEQAAKWEAENKEKDNWLGKALKFQEQWWMQILFAILLLVGVKAVSNWLMSTSEGLEEDEEDEEVGMKLPKKYNLLG